MARAFLVVGLGFGDEGKGGICDFLTRKHHSPLTVRFNGGAQCAHNVIDDETGRHHTFAQFGSGTFAGARTFLSRHMLFNPVSLISEARHLVEIGVPNPYKLLTVDKAALVTTPFHIAANRMREIHRSDIRIGRHGSCGMGVGETMDYSLKFPQEAVTVADILAPGQAHEKLSLLHHRLKEDVGRLYDPGLPAMAPEWEILNDFEGTMAALERSFAIVRDHVELAESAWLDEELVKDQTIVFEGAQGVLLDENYGFHPHTTWSTTTFEWADELVRRVKGVESKRIGVLRGYMTRHGHGPFVTEDVKKPVPKGEHNTLGRWQADFRTGHFDGLMAKYALEVVGGVDELALTCLDHLGDSLIKSTWEYTLRERPLAELKSPDSPRWYRIHVDRLGDDLDAHLQAQESLGRMLSAFRPVYQEAFNVETFVAQVESATETPVKLLSFGPKASDKRAR